MCGRTEIEEAGEELDAAGQEGEDDGDGCARALRVLLRHQRHHHRGAHRDLAHRAEHRVHQRARERRVQSVLCPDRHEQEKNKQINKHAHQHARQKKKNPLFQPGLDQELLSTPWKRPHLKSAIQSPCEIEIQRNGCFFSTFVKITKILIT